MIIDKSHRGKDEKNVRDKIDAIIKKKTTKKFIEINHRLSQLPRNTSHRLMKPKILHLIRKRKKN